MIGQHILLTNYGIHVHHTYGRLVIYVQVRLLLVLYQIMVLRMDEGGLLKCKDSKSLEKLDKAGLNLKQK